ncbi:hypothetical protein EVAR_21105_1 [Eumeta japonica]|uniref:Uncharacterized protein n=1 Tax=Eumeta variegata TaxID=151549 RepID=A0A4C1VTQ8_EUMVA|nr:hypothetical protein EVAR_21105_1 [Eumeta japonica]
MRIVHIREVVADKNNKQTASAAIGRRAGGGASASAARRPPRARPAVAAFGAIALHVLRISPKLDRLIC